MLFLKINVKSFSQSLTDGLAQSYRNFNKSPTSPSLSIKFYILNTAFNLIRMQFSFSTPSLFYFRFVKMLYSLKILLGNSKWEYFPRSIESIQPFNGKRGENSSEVSTTPEAHMSSPEKLHLTLIFTRHNSHPQFEVLRLLFSSFSFTVVSRVIKQFSLRVL